MVGWLQDNGLLLGLAALDGLAYAALVFMVAVGVMPIPTRWKSWRNC